MTSTSNMPEIYFDFEEEEEDNKSRSQSPENDLYEVVETGQEEDANAYDPLEQNTEETTFTKTEKVSLKEEPTLKEPKKSTRRRESVYLVLAVTFFVVVVAQAMAIGYLLSPDLFSKDPCNPNPCGNNTNRFSNENTCRCECLPNFLGDPKEGCKQECVKNSDCPSNKTCISSECVDPCNSAVCGLHAKCTVNSHMAFCTCNEGYHRSGGHECKAVPNPCNPNPCGLNTISKIDGSNCICLCKPGFHGNPNSGCNKIECETSSNCSLGKSCLDMKCSIVNCSRNSFCKITNGFPTCRSVWLVGGRSNSEGNVFAYNSITKIEGPVCDDDWDINDANVVCKELGFSGAKNRTFSSTYGAVPGAFSFDDVSCYGTETHLQDCTHSTSHNCGGSEGAGVVCH